MNSTHPTYTVVVDADKSGSRLDRLLADATDDFSRVRIQALIASGLVLRADGEAALDPSERVRPGETFAVYAPPPTQVVATPEPMPLSIVYEDAVLIVVDKPAGLVVHPGAGNWTGTLVNGLLAHASGGLSSVGAPLRPGIVHRLDKETSGLIVVAKTDAAHHALTAQFSAHTVERAYRAVVWGDPKPPVGRIDKPIARSRIDRKKMSTAGGEGKRACTDYRRLSRCGSRASMIECRLTTGRTHQIRVHLASIGYPLVGDAVYGGRTARHCPAAFEKGGSNGGSRHALHAFLIGFRHPTSQKMLRFFSPLPRDINELIRLLESL
ncbi:MAG: RluA family pseudouridine synthase [Rhodospirillales bacterium]|nr:RluA family pseudouridine synthase [Rhodospirillales bacterium]